MCVFCASLSLSITSAAGLALVTIVTMARYPSILIIRKLWKTKAYYLHDLKLHSVHLESHSEVARRERECVHEPGVPLLRLRVGA